MNAPESPPPETLVAVHHRTWHATLQLDAALTGSSRRGDHRLDSRVDGFGDIALQEDVRGETRGSRGRFRVCLFVSRAQGAEDERLRGYERSAIPRSVRLCAERGSGGITAISQRRVQGQTHMMLRTCSDAC
jgi:hypothetical protein